MNDGSIKLQSDEFDAASALRKVLGEAVAIVDDDYPRWRHSYESALRDLLDKCAANGRYPTRDKVIKELSLPARLLLAREAIDAQPNSREKSLALTKLDECEMWLEKTL